MKLANGIGVLGPAPGLLLDNYLPVPPIFVGETESKVLPHLLRYGHVLGPPVHPDPSDNPLRPEPPQRVGGRRPELEVGREVGELPALLLLELFDLHHRQPHIVLQGCIPQELWGPRTTRGIQPLLQLPPQLVHPLPTLGLGLLDDLHPVAHGGQVPPVHGPLIDVALDVVREFREDNLILHEQLQHRFPFLQLVRHGVLLLVARELLLDLLKFEHRPAEVAGLSYNLVRTQLSQELLEVHKRAHLVVLVAFA
mmetsp:Transcript_47749/g.126341  ORF Transcript_47749/g.126341 Transcript_47749/m.126341 type:complete len:253 (+) Transcript_47749:174-932(+)